MVTKTIFKNLNERAFKSIIEGRKKIEIRANKNDSDNEQSFNNLKKGDFIIFKKLNSEEKIKCLIQNHKLYQNVRELLEIEGTENTLSSSTNIEEGIKSIESIENYKDLIEKNGVFAIHIKFLKKL